MKVVNVGGTDNEKTQTGYDRLGYWSDKPLFLYFESFVSFWSTWSAVRKFAVLSAERPKEPLAGDYDEGRHRPARRDVSIEVAVEGRALARRQPYRQRSF
jgi:hypothetical protein